MRQKRDVILVVFSVILLLLMAGCTGGKTVAGAPTTPFMGGTQGLEIGFLEGTPPDEVTDGGYFDFQAMVGLKNLGEYDLKRGQVKASLMGFLPSDFNAGGGLKDINPKDDLTPKQRDSEGNVIEPVETYVIFPSDTTSFNFRGNIVGNTPFTFRAEVCYRYQTKAISEICVLENMIDAASDAICKPNDPKIVFSSGSPIQVTSFRQNAIGKDKIQFSLDIVHSGSGSVFDATIDADCPKDSASRRMKEDKVKVTIDTGLGGALNCAGLGGGSGFVKLINGKRSITCTQTGVNIGEYKKSVNIILDFNYLASVDKAVLVKHLLDTVSGTSYVPPTTIPGGGNIPSQPQLTSPINGVTVCTAPMLKWTGAANSYYRIKYSKIQNDLSSLTPIIVGSDSEYQLSNLDVNTLYYWGVMACGNSDSSSCGPLQTTYGYFRTVSSNVCSPAATTITLFTLTPQSTTHDNIVIPNVEASPSCNGKTVRVAGPNIVQSAKPVMCTLDCSGKCLTNTYMSFLAPQSASYPYSPAYNAFIDLDSNVVQDPATEPISTPVILTVTS